MKRQIYIITLGFILGILRGLLLKKFPFLLLILIFITLLIKILDIKLNSKVYRVLKVFIKNNIILMFLITTFTSSVYVYYLENKYNKIYNSFSQKEIIATVISEKEESEYKYSYIIKLEEYKNIKFILRIPKNKESIIEYGDKIKINGEYVAPTEQRNYGGFNYRSYLKTQGISGIYNSNSITIISKNNLNTFQLICHKVKTKIIYNIQKILPEETRSLFLDMLIGYKGGLSQEIQESFRNSSLSHILVVSGMHVTYLILGIDYILKVFKIRKRIRDFLICIVLVFFMSIANFTPSVIRASIMQILGLLALILYRKTDTRTTISISILIILILNPYKIFDTGLQLSYCATISILVYNKLFNKGNSLNAIRKYIKDNVFMSLFINLYIAPIIIYKFNMASLVFIISNIAIGALIAPIIIGGIILIIISFFNFKLIIYIAKIYNLLLIILLRITNLIGNLKLSQIIVITPNIVSIIIYYITLLIVTYLIYLKQNYNNRYIVKKIFIFLKPILVKSKNNFFNLIIICLIFILIISLIKIIPKDFKIYFIDVGQGDSSLIITPTNKKVLIDSGGSESTSYDVGKSVLVPYLLDRKINKIDYIVISHFDTDHCNGFKYLLEKIEVDNVIISRQFEETENFKEIYEIIINKKINLRIVKQGDILNFDRYTVAKVLNPANELSEDINNNSIVIKITCFNKSCLFTGDISQDKEKELIKKYGKELQSDILKVAHHGSKNSSCEEFLKEVNPGISLIGVGENNKFGHPSDEVIKRLEEIKSAIYRTDIYGEIEIKISKNKKIKIEKKKYATKNSCN